MTGVPFPDQRIRFDYERSADWANHDERNRQVGVLRGIGFELWSRPSRCNRWSVHDVVRHVVHMNESLLGAIAAARAGERFSRLRGFDAQLTPAQWLAEAPAATPEQTWTDYLRSSADLVATIDALDEVDLLVPTPAGRQSWQRAVYHGLFDALVHERDITEPLGCSAAPFPSHEPVLGYALLLACRLACAAGRSFSVTLDLGEDVNPLAVSVNGEEIVVEPTDIGVVPADPLALLDGLSGRVPLCRVLGAPTPVVDALALLAHTL